MVPPPKIRRKAVRTTSASTQCTSPTTSMLIIAPQGNEGQQRNEEPPGNEGAFCTICCECRSGIEFDRQFRYCIVCKLDVCLQCCDAGRHNATHLSPSFIIRSQPILSDSSTTKPCSECSEENKSGLECASCSVMMCSSCVCNADSPLLAHEGHEMIRRTILAGGGITAQGVTQAAEICDGHSSSAKFHCSRCLRTIDMLEDSVHECVTCNGDPVCRSCVGIVKQFHNQDHKWVSFRGMKDSPNAVPGSSDSRLFRCQSCDFGAQSALKVELATHDHSEFWIMMNDNFYQAASANAWRKCLLKSPRTSTWCQPTGGSFNCAWCQNAFPSENQRTCLSCLGGNLLMVYCADCFHLATRTHWHSPEDFVCPSTSTKLGDANTEVLPDCGILIENQTMRKWYTPHTLGDAYISFTPPTPLMDQWQWYQTTSGESLFVCRKAGVERTLTKNPLDLPSSAWRKKTPLPDGWLYEDTNYVHIRTQRKIKLRPSGSYVFQLQPLPPGWFLKTDADSARPIFYNVYSEGEPTTHTDPRIWKVQWRPIPLRDSFEILETGCPDGSCVLFDTTKSLQFRTPPCPDVLPEDQRPYGQALHHKFTSGRIEEEEQILRNKLARMTISQTNNVSPQISPQTTSATPQILSPPVNVNPQLVPPRRKMSKTAWTKVGIKGFAVGLQLGTALFGNPLSVDTSFLGSIADSLGTTTVSPPVIAPDNWDPLQDAASAPIQ